MIMNSALLREIRSFRHYNLRSRIWDDEEWRLEEWVEKRYIYELSQIDYNQLCVHDFRSMRKYLWDYIMHDTTSCSSSFCKNTDVIACKKLKRCICVSCYSLLKSDPSRFHIYD